MPKLNRIIANAFGKYELNDFTDEEKEIYEEVQTNMETHQLDWNGNYIEQYENNLKLGRQLRSDPVYIRQIDDKLDALQVFKRIHEKINAKPVTDDNSKEQANQVMREGYAAYHQKFNAWQRFWGHIFTFTAAGKAYKEFEDGVSEYSKITGVSKNDVYRIAETPAASKPIEEPKNEIRLDDEPAEKKEEKAPENTLDEKLDLLDKKKQELVEETANFNELNDNIADLKQKYEENKAMLYGTDQEVIDAYINEKKACIVKGEDSFELNKICAFNRIDFARRQLLDTMAECEIDIGKRTDSENKIKAIENEIDQLNKETNPVNEEKEDVFRRPLSENEQAELNNELDQKEDAVNDLVKMDNDIAEADMSKGNAK